MKKKTGFEKFQVTKKSGAALKEQIRQEKKKITKERKEYFEKQRAERFAPKEDKPVVTKPAIQRVVPEQMPLNKFRTAGYVPAAMLWTLSSGAR
jgi:23S rRNA pseudouridine2605 synthase